MFIVNDIYIDKSYIYTVFVSLMEDKEIKHIEIMSLLIEI